MKKKEILKIGDFAKFSRTTRDTLLYYDKIGLLSPVLRGDNNYRYYSTRQLSVVNLIRTYQTLGIPLTEIKRLRDNRTPDFVDMLLDNHIERLDEEIAAWVRARKLLHLLKTVIHSQLDVDETEIKVQYCPAEAIMLGEQNDYSRGKNDYDALVSFYHAMQKKYPGLDLNYPVWALFSEERIKKRDWSWPDRYYFYNPEGCDEKPASLYATGYARGGYGQTHDLYVQMLDYIDSNGFEICGPAYEEYPLNEICVLEDKNYLIHLMIAVRAKAKQ